MKSQNVKISFIFQAYVLVTCVMEMAATWVASVIFIYVYRLYCNWFIRLLTKLLFYRPTDPTSN